MAGLANSLSKLAVPGIIALGIAQSSIYDGRYTLPSILVVQQLTPPRPLLRLQSPEDTAPSSLIASLVSGTRSAPAPTRLQKIHSSPTLLYRTDSPRRKVLTCSSRGFRCVLCHRSRPLVAVGVHSADTPSILGYSSTASHPLRRPHQASSAFTCLLRRCRVPSPAR